MRRLGFRSISKSSISGRRPGKLLTQTLIVPRGSTKLGFLSSLPDNDKAWDGLRRILCFAGITGYFIVNSLLEQRQCLDTDGLPTMSMANLKVNLERNKVYSIYLADDHSVIVSISGSDGDITDYIVNFVNLDRFNLFVHTTQKRAGILQHDLVYLHDVSTEIDLSSPESRASLINLTALGAFVAFIYTRVRMTSAPQTLTVKLGSWARALFSPWTLGYFLLSEYAHRNGTFKVSTSANLFGSVPEPIQLEVLESMLIAGEVATIKYTNYFAPIIVTTQSGVSHLVALSRSDGIDQLMTLVTVNGIPVKSTVSVVYLKPREFLQELASLDTQSPK